MLAPQEFSVGPLASASGMTLVLRRHQQEASFLVTSATNAPTAIFLDDEFRFVCMPSADNTSWNGILIPNVAIELDETRILDANEGQPPGALVRKKSQLFIMAKYQPQGPTTPIAIVSNLPRCLENQSAAFGRWQIVLGEGLSKRVLMKIDATTK
jgi:hypothetical protein